MSPVSSQSAPSSAPPPSQQMPVNSITASTVAGMIKDEMRQGEGSQGIKQKIDNTLTPQAKMLLLLMGIVLAIAIVVVFTLLSSMGGANNTNQTAPQEEEEQLYE